MPMYYIDRESQRNIHINLKQKEIVATIINYSYIYDVENWCYLAILFLSFSFLQSNEIAPIHKYG